VKNLQDILYRAGLQEIVGTADPEISSISFDSRTVEPGTLFIAVRGTQVDGHDYIDQAIELGARVIVCEEIPEVRNEEVIYIRVANSAKALGHIASNFFGNPSAKLKLVGITGTNGKTTTATLLHELFTHLGYKAGLLSTVRSMVHRQPYDATHTTPDAIRLNRLLSTMVEEGCDYAFMEVSSHAIDQDRTAGLEFSGGVFTNITHDHLDYHKTFRNYIHAKKKFFDQLPASAFSLTNVDDKNGMVMVQNTKSKIETYGLKSMARFKGKVLENHFDGLLMNINGQELHSMLCGDFNAYNLLAVYGVAILLGMDNTEVLTALSRLKGAEGRFELVRSKDNRTGIVDYAHTPDALENVLRTINAIRTMNEQLITVVGAGGDRDKAKRPRMAHIASLLSTSVILTSDNPRSEDPEKILEEMRAGIDPARSSRTMVIANREEAIKTAVNLSRSGDIILVAGKGHEKYQEIAGIKHPFDDKKILLKLFEVN
jgi:UDP-N-acetylmuramoyl-L-alanyl-D-glutamate--2,6-diaminopimelate ligase